MAREMGLGVIPWSPLASGVLTGKYQQSDLDEHGSAGAEGTRKNVALGNGALSERGLKIAEVVKAVAGEMGKEPPQVALAWTLLNAEIAAPVRGVRTLEKFEANLGGLTRIRNTYTSVRLEGERT